MNLYGVVTGTNDYSLNVSFPNSFRLSVGDTITIRPLRENTGASTLNIGFGAMPLTLNGDALTSGQLEADKDRQCTFIGSGFALDSAGSGSGYTPSGNSSQILLGNGNASSTLPVGIVSAADIPEHSADKLTSGTIPAARLPGVLANVDTHGELLSAAGAQPAATGTPNGSKYLRDDNSWQAVSATDSTKLPLAGGVLTGAVALTGTHTNPSACGFWRWGGAFVVNSDTGQGVYLNIGGGTFAIMSPTGFVMPNSLANGLLKTDYGFWRDAQATYIQSGGGCIVSAARLVSRANSTAYSLCVAPTGDVLRILLQDSSSKRAVALVDASGTVTFEAGSHADYVVGSSPASGEVGVYITGGVLTLKPGSAGARSIAAHVSRAQA